MTLWTPNRTNVQMSGKDKVCVLVHHLTGRILCFCLDDPFVSRFTDAGYLKIEIKHASEYDMYAKRIREQAKAEDEAEDHAYLERENETRQRLRQQLRDRLNAVTTGAERQAVESALHCLEVMEKKRQRYRQESFFLQEAFEDSKADPAGEIISKAMTK